MTAEDVTTEICSHISVRMLWSRLQHRAAQRTWADYGPGCSLGQATGMPWLQVDYTSHKTSALTHNNPWQWLTADDFPKGKLDGASISRV